MHLIRCSPPAPLSLRSPESGAILSRTLSQETSPFSPSPSRSLYFGARCLFVCCRSFFTDRPPSRPNFSKGTCVSCVECCSCCDGRLGAAVLLPSCSHPSQVFPPHHRPLFTNRRIWTAGGLVPLERSRSYEARTASNYRQNPPGSRFST